jgi:hypothetical protein
VKLTKPEAYLTVSFDECVGAWGDASGSIIEVSWVGNTRAEHDWSTPLYRCR